MLQATLDQRHFPQQPWSHSSSPTHIPVQRGDILVAGDVLASLSDAVPEYQLRGAAVAVLVQVPDPCRGVSRPTATKSPNKDSYANSRTAPTLCAIICSCRTQSTEIRNHSLRTGGNTNICQHQHVECITRGIYCSFF